MIDLRSDTLTQPTENMRNAMYKAEVGDDARTECATNSEDPTVRLLEEMASEVTGKEAALFCNSGTMANYISLLVHCNRGEKVLLSKNSHINRSEKGVFMEDIFGLVPLFYNENKYGEPDLESIKKILQRENVKLLCLENTNNYHGGTCLSLKKMEDIFAVAKMNRIPIHLDGARIFNAEIALGTSVKDFSKSMDSIMFCLSKGLGAPVGSMLCGNLNFINEARKIRELLGGAMRQSGIIAAAGIEALKNYHHRIVDDHKKTELLANNIKVNSFVSIDYQAVQTNILNVDISNSKKSAQTMQSDLFKRGLNIKAVDDYVLRLTVYSDISEEQIIRAADIFNGYIE